MCKVKVFAKMRNKLKQPKTILNDLKRPKNDLKPSKTTTNNQCKSLIGSSEASI